MYVQFEAEIEKLNQRVEQQASERFGARLLMTHPGVGPITVLATEVFPGRSGAIRKQQGAGQTARNARISIEKTTLEF
jgi:transposase